MVKSKFFAEIKISLMKYSSLVYSVSSTWMHWFTSSFTSERKSSTRFSMSLSILSALHSSFWRDISSSPSKSWNKPLVGSLFSSCFNAPMSGERFFLGLLKIMWSGTSNSRKQVWESNGNYTKHKLIKLGLNLQFLKLRLDLRVF